MLLAIIIRIQLIKSQLTQNMENQIDEVEALNIGCEYGEYDKN